jgi:hypothetical protein
VGSAREVARLASATTRTLARHLYFPLDGAVLLMAAIDGKRMLGVGMVGRDGMSGSHFR